MSREQQGEAPGRQRQAQKAATRRLVLDAARELFACKGYDKTTIRGVAKRAQVGLGTVCAHFPDKPSLLIAALLDDLVRVGTEAIASLPPVQVPVCDRFLHLAGCFYVYYAKQPALSRTLLRNIWFQDGQWAMELKAKEEIFVGLTTGMLEQARDQGEIRADAECPLAAKAFFFNYIMVLFEGLGRSEFNPIESLELLSRILDQLMQGIGGIAVGSR